jgi:hypothetical protein
VKEASIEGLVGRKGREDRDKPAMEMKGVKRGMELKSPMWVSQL